MASTSQTRAPTAPATAGKADWAAVVRTSGPGGRSRRSDARGVLSRAEMTSRIGQLCDMGFSEAASRKALESDNWNVNTALDRLFIQGHDEASALQAEGTASSNASITDLGSPQAVPAQASKLPEAGEETATRCPSDSNSQGSGDEASSLRDGTGDSSQISETPRQPSLHAVGTLQSSAPSSGTAIAGSARDDSLADASPMRANAHKGAERRLELDEVAAPEEEALPKAEEAPAKLALDQGQDASAVLPLRQLWRVQSDWTEADPNKLAVQKGELVYLWPGTETDLGWAYGELAFGAPGAGWLPLAVVERLPLAQQVLRARQKVVPSFENQLPLREGAGYLVDTATRTAEGWTHATELHSASSGWVPAAALAWPTELL